MKCICTLKDDLQIAGTSGRPGEVTSGIGVDRDIWYEDV